MLGMGLAVLGGLMAGVSIFLPLADAPGILPVDDNSLIQTDQGAAIGVALLALLAFSGAYDYYRTGSAGIRSMVAGGALVGGAIVAGNSDSYFELTTYGNEFLPDTVRAKAAIALYVTGAGGAAMLVGGYLMRQDRIDHSSEVEPTGGWEPDPRDPERERWREGSRWTEATRPRE